MRGALSIRRQGRRYRRALRRRVTRLANKRRRLVRALRRRLLRRYYRAQLRRPIQPDLAVFAAYWYRGYACNPKAIYEKARELVPGFRGVWVVKAEAVGSLPPEVPYVTAGTRAYYRLLARAKYLVNNVNFPNEVVKRDGTIHVQTHHGTPLKKMGLDLADLPDRKVKLNFDAMMRRCARWDLSISANAFTTKIWERVYPTDYVSLEIGYPRNDVLANATPSDVRRARARLGVADSRMAVLYAPTHREYEDGYVPLLDVGRVAKALEPDQVLMVRTHYYYDPDDELQRLGAAGRILLVADHPSVEELCIAADALITDYSSIMFDYGVLNRPIVIYAPDWEIYQTRRGTYFDLMAEPPGHVARSEDELIDLFRSGAVSNAESTALRAAFRDKFCYLDDGRAAERLVRHVWLSSERSPRVRRDASRGTA